MKTCGIYSITNTANGKRYYGSSLNVDGRRRQHWSDLRNGRHKNPHLQSAWNVYGESSFVFALVEEVAAEKLIEVEQRYLDANDASGYNIGKCAECATRGLKWPEESKKRISAARKGVRLSDETKRKLSDAGKGRKKSQETRGKLRVANLGKKHSGTTRKKISESGRNNWNDQQYRERLIAAQHAGKSTAAAKANYSAAAVARWTSPEQREALSAERKARWTNPEYRAKMLEKRRIQGQKLRERNLKKKETEHALS